MQHPPHRWVPRILLAALLAVVGACTDGPMEPLDGNPDSAEITLSKTKTSASTGATTGGGATTQGWTKICDSDGTCIYYDDGGGDECDPEKAIVDCGGGSGGGSGGEYTMGDETWDCFPQDTICDLRPATYEEVQKLQSAINSIRTDHSTCSRFRNNAQAMLNRGLQVWDNTITAPEGGYVRADTHWGDARGPMFHFWTQGISAKNVVHEAMHGTYWSGDTRPMKHRVYYGGRLFEDRVRLGGWEAFCTS